MQFWALKSDSSHDRNRLLSVRGRSVYSINHQPLIGLKKKGHWSWPCRDRTWAQVIVPWQHMSASHQQHGTATDQPRNRYPKVPVTMVPVLHDRQGIRVVIKRTSTVFWVHPRRRAQSPGIRVSLGRMSKLRLAGPAQSRWVDIPHRTAVSCTWRAVGEHAGELNAQTIGHRSKISNRDHWELSKNRLDWNYV